MEVFTQWSILHLVIVTVEMHLRGFSLVLCCHILPTQNQSLFLALLLILLGDELSTSELLSVEPFSPGKSLQCVLWMWLSRSVQRHRPHLDTSLAMPAVHSQFMYNCGSNNIVLQPSKATYFSDESSQFHMLPMCMLFRGV